MELLISLSITSDINSMQSNLNLVTSFNINIFQLRLILRLSPYPGADVSGAYITFESHFVTMVSMLHTTEISITHIFY